MILFFISFCLVCLSSYLLTSIFAPKARNLGILYFFMFAFAQVVLILEGLSLFSAIGEFGILLGNSLITLGSYYIWQKKGKPLWHLYRAGFWHKFINSLKLDKSLIWLSVAFVFFLLITIFLCIVVPANSPDGYAYHLVRTLFWIESGSLNHFSYPDVRALCMPINSEILYSWVIVFLKKDFALGFFAFVGYLLSIVSIYNILGLLGYSLRRKLWVIFVLSSFSGVIAQASGMETDIMVAGLVLACINMFWCGLKENKKTSIFVASLAYALAIGVKTTAIMAIPAVGVFLLALCVYYKKKDFYKPFGWFLLFGLFNFLIFASYNYVLNFINYGNPMGARSLIEVSRNIYGLKAIPANFIKYTFLFFDFSSFKWSEYIGDEILQIRGNILAFLHLSSVKDGLYTTRELVVNNKLMEVFMLGGILGFLIYLPTWFVSFFRVSFKSRKKMFNFLFALMLLINILVMSYLLCFMVYSVRFLLFFVILSSPILVFTYFKSKNPLKYIVVFFVLSNFIIITTHLQARPFFKIVDMLKTNSITEFRLKAHCSGYKDLSEMDGFCFINKRLQDGYLQDKKIIFFVNAADNIYHLKKMMFNGYQIDFGNLENIKNIDLKKYDLAIFSQQFQGATVIYDFENRVHLYEDDGKTVRFEHEYSAPCLYYDLQSEMIHKGDKKYPFMSQCFVTKKFLAERNLHLVDFFDIYLKRKEIHQYYGVYRTKK